MLTAVRSGYRRTSRPVRAEGHREGALSAMFVSRIAAQSVIFRRSEVACYVLAARVEWTAGSRRACPPIRSGPSKQPTTSTSGCTTVVDAYGAERLVELALADATIGRTRTVPAGGPVHPNRRSPAHRLAARVDPRDADGFVLTGQDGFPATRLGPAP